MHRLTYKLTKQIIIQIDKHSDTQIGIEIDTWIDTQTETQFDKYTDIKDAI